MATKQELQERLAALQESQAKAVAAANEAQEIAALELKCAEAERAGKEAQAISDAVGRFGAVGTGCAVFSTPHGIVILKCPETSFFQRYYDGQSASVSAQEALVRSCLVYPSRAEFDDLFEKLPALIIPLNNGVLDLAGFAVKQLHSK